jgi:AraC-like DNA-binding protein
VAESSHLHQAGTSVWWPPDRPDLLSEAIGAIELAGSVQVRAVASGTWGIHFEAGDPAMFHIVERGECWIRVHDHLPLRMVPGEVTLIKPGLAHDIVSSPTAPTRRSVSPSKRPARHTVSYHLGRGRPHAVFVCGALHFGRTASHPLLTLLPSVLHVSGAGAPDAGTLAALMHQVAREAGEGRPGADLIVRRLSDVFFVQVLRAWMEAQPAGGGGWLAAVNDPQIGNALRAIHSNPRRRWSVAALAREAAQSRSAFAARFAQLSGEPPMQYLARWRMLLAAEALRDGNQTVASIAANVGYSSVAAFVRAFTRLVGVSPVEYRRGTAPGNDRA